MSKEILDCTTAIVQSWAGANVEQLEPIEVSAMIRTVYETLQEVSGSLNSEVAGLPQAGDSIQKDRVLCLECGKAFRLLSNRHLNLHGLTPTEYKVKHGIRKTQSLSARNLSSKRRRLAKERNMGKELAEWRERRKSKTNIP